MRTLLHAACGPATKADLEWLGFHEWENEVRLDIDPDCKPDVLGDLRDIDTWELKSNAVKHSPADPMWSAEFDGVFCSHALEHLHLYDVPKALATFRAVLKPGGLMFLIVPNFLAACRHVVNGDGRKFYESDAGEIFAHEVVYGKEDWTATMPYMQHKCGFTPDLLRGVVIGAGFLPAWFEVDDFNLKIGARKP